MKNNIKFIVLYYRCFRGKQIKNKSFNFFKKFDIYILYINIDFLKNLKLLKIT